MNTFDEGISITQARLAERLGDWMRAGAARAADRVEAARAPLGTLGRATQEFGNVSARCLGRLLEHNAAMTERALSEGVARLREIASAPDAFAAWREQREALPVFGERLAAELRSGMGIVSEGGREITSLVRETWAALARPAREARKTARRKRTRARATAKRAARSKARSTH